jgi:hypothetical protein
MKKMQGGDLSDEESLDGMNYDDEEDGEDAVSDDDDEADEDGS